jgi:hypothetical protein
LTPIAHIGAGVVGAFLLDTLIFHRPVTTETLGLAMGLSLLPDLDIPVVAVRSQNWPPRERNNHHTSFTHTPLFYLAVTLALALFLPTRVVVLFGALTLLHLAFDSWATDDGIMWLWPCRKKQYTLFPASARGDDVYGWRYYRHHYLQEHRHAAWTEMGLMAMGLVVVIATAATALSHI